MEKVYFVSGIDTDAGKSYATAYIARCWNENAHKTITQKFIQTGNVGRSEDIELHRRIMGWEMTAEDKAMTTMPEIFTYPASPALASRIDGREIDFDKIAKCTQKLLEVYDTVLLEGAGGLMVPLIDGTYEGADRLVSQCRGDIYLTIDYVAENNLPLIFVTSGKLGSVNHTLLSLEAIRARGIRLDILAYNLYPEVEDRTILEDTRRFLKAYLTRYFPEAQMIDIPVL